MRQMFFVRYAETLVTGVKVLNGKASAPDPISPLGLQQAKPCGQALASLHLQDPRAYSSSYLRAALTALEIARVLGSDVTVVNGLQEMEMGQWARRPYSAPFKETQPS